MARNSTIYLRRAGLTLLKGDDDLQDIVGDRVYPPQRPANPQWPFIGWGVPTVGPFEASCLDGNDITVAVHSYAATEGEGEATISGEEQATRMAERVAAVLADAGEIDLADYGCPYPAKAHFTWQGTDVIQDAAEADAFHGITRLRAVVTS